MDSDELLLERWREGDQRAGNELFRRHFARVRRFVANKIDDEVEDLVQRTFMSLVTQPNRFEGRSAFIVFLLGVAHNLVRAHWRKRQPTRDIDFDLVSIADLGAGPSTLLTRAREERLLLEALRRIPFEAQVVLETHLWERLTGPQLAELFGIGEPAVRSRIRRAKERLAKTLESLEGSGIVLDSTTTDLEGWAERIRRRVDEDGGGEDGGEEGE